MNLTGIANELKELKEKIILIYAFNSTGKTRLSVEYKNLTKKKNGKHAGVYYNAYSEDLFVWDNDTENDETNIRLTLKESSLNQFHQTLNENLVWEKLVPFNPQYDFFFKWHDDVENGIAEISFFTKEDNKSPIKISRGEERIFVWGFFLSLFEIEGWSDIQNSHFFIDDPVSSFDDHNIFVTAITILDLIKKHHTQRKIIITTHHIGFLSILADWLKKGDDADKYKDILAIHILNRNNNMLSLVNSKKDVFLFHLFLMKKLNCLNDDDLCSYHFGLLRQLLENISSFLGCSRFSFVLDQIGMQVSSSSVASIINSYSHQKAYFFQSEMMKPEDKLVFKEILKKLQEKYSFYGVDE